MLLKGEPPMLRIAALTLLLIWSTTAFANAYPKAYKDGEQAFNAGKYHQAHETLRPFYLSDRQHSEVSYWIGSSQCRDNLRKSGREWLRHTRISHQISAQQEAAIDLELQRCSSPAAPPAAAQWIYARQRIRAELLYFGQDTRLLPRPIRYVDGELPQIANRVTSLKKPADAERLGKSLAATIPFGPERSACGVTRPFRVRMYGPFRFITRLVDDKTIDAYGAVLENARAQIQESTGLEAPPSFITVYLATCQDEAALMARAAHGLLFDQSQVAGYSVGDDLSMLAVWDGSAFSGDSNTVRTLRHELAHLVTDYRFGDMPNWLGEGFAQYFGVISTDRRTGAETWLHPSWPALPPLKNVLEASWARIDAAASSGPADTCVAIVPEMMRADAARMFVAYIDAVPGRLLGLFGRLRSLTPDDWSEAENGQIGAIEQYLGQPVDTLDDLYMKASIVKRDARVAAFFKKSDAQTLCSHSARAALLSGFAASMFRKAISALAQRRSEERWP